MKFTVYHAKEPTFGFGEKPIFPEAYEKVAIVECEDLEDAFRATNHIDTAWTKNPEVVETFKARVRSTSVGDVVVNANGREFYCDMVGWTEVA